MKNTVEIVTLITSVWLLTSLVVPRILGGKFIFLADALLWASVIAVSLYASKRQQINIWQVKNTVVYPALVVAVFQIFLLFFASFFTGFGKNANVWTPSALTFYFPYLIVPFLAVELSRAYLTKTCSKRKPTLTLLLISLFYTLTATTLSRYTSLTTPLETSAFLIKTFIPTLTISLLATYLAYLGGFTANLTYMAIPAVFTWFSPILPNPPWEAQSMITVIAATTGFLFIDQSIRPLPTKRLHRSLRKHKSQMPYWTAIMLIGLVAVWSSTGLLGFTPTIIASGSMQPTMKTGDIAIVVKVPIDTIKVGDVIQYMTPDMPVIHRVIETSSSEVLVTKGDANTAPDDPILSGQVMGKVIFTIPKIGWVSITLKTAITEVASFFLNNITTSYTILGITLALSTFGFHKYRNQPLRKLRRRLKR